MFLKWRREPIYVAFNTVSTPIHKVPFPAITVCNMNQVNIKAVDEIIDGLAENNTGNEDNSMLMTKAGLLQGMCEDVDFGLALNQVQLGTRYMGH